jgi:murein DD-endopeptidase MepM/ murein hydrolase activator NlpD
MASNPFESQWIYGLHDPGGEQIMLAANKTGWIVFSEAVGHDPRNRAGQDFRPYSSRGFGVICRINNGYHPHGTLPLSRYYGEFAQRVGHFVASSPGCRIWIIGNETNYDIERPLLSQRQRPGQDSGQPGATAAASQSPFGWLGRFRHWLSGFVESGPRPANRGGPGAFTVPAPADDPYFRGLPQRFSALLETGDIPAPSGDSRVHATMPSEVITPALYAQCYRLCRDAIHRTPGHEQDQVLVAAPAPWNNQTQYPGNERGDWVRYLQDVLELLGPDYCDGFTLHTYTHGADVRGITSEVKMRPPFADRRFDFRVYQDFLNAAPPSMRHLPVYITETDQVDAWKDENTGWVQAAYQEIDEWNQQPGTQKIRALALYRWPRFDRWYIDGNQGVVTDFRSALATDYRWDRSQPQPASYRRGNRLKVLGSVNLRRSPGYVGKPVDDRVAELQPGQQVVVIEDGTSQTDALIWWKVQVAESQPPVVGWLAQFGPDGAPLVELLASEEPPPTTPPTKPPDPPASSVVKARLQRGQRVRLTTIVNARRSPGYVNKRADDVVQEMAAGMVLRLSEGPQVVDGLVWWLGAIDGGGAIGWMAENSPTGAALLELVDQSVPPTSPPARFKPGDRALTVAFVRLRRTPGYMNKPPDDVVADIWQGMVAVIVSGPKSLDGLIWWEVETQEITGKGVRGWMAESAPGGVPLLSEWTAEDRTPFKPGDLAVVGSAPVRVRRTPGFLAKPDNDVIGEFASRTTLLLQEGPRSQDNIAWWRVFGVTQAGKVNGWVAQGATNGATLVGRAPKLQGTDVPNLQQQLFLATPFSGQAVITQLWGENPSFYARYFYDGVPLRGHNGIDFGTPQGTSVLASDQGAVVQVGYEPTGFGHFVLLAHGWGQSIYAHLNNISVQMGQRVGRAETIGISGNTGGSSGPHLHFAIRIHPFTRTDGWGGFSDPLPYLNPRDVAWPSYMMDVGPQQIPRPEIDQRPPPGMADDAPGYIRA